LWKCVTYLQSWEENQRRRISRETELSNLNQLVFDFFRQARAKGIPITGGLLKATAMEFASSLRIEGFKASNGWLGNGREGIMLNSINGVEKAQMLMKKS